MDNGVSSGDEDGLLTAKIERPTSKLRFKGDVLQQEWETQFLKAGVLNETRYEWRDVPKE